MIGEYLPRFFSFLPQKIKFYQKETRFFLQNSLMYAIIYLSGGDHVKDYAFGNFLAELRAEKGLSQSELGEMLGVTNKAVSKWENGTAKPNTKLIPELAKVLGVSVEELFAAKRIEKDDEAEKVKSYLCAQKKKFAYLYSAFLSVLLRLFQATCRIMDKLPLTFLRI